MATNDTFVTTPHGPRRAAHLGVGDVVTTRDNGAQEIRHISTRALSIAADTLCLRLQPILIRKGALGTGLPSRDLLVSPAHRILLERGTSGLVFDTDEVLVAARYLVGMPGVEHWVASEVAYRQFHFDGHEVIEVNGVWGEIFQPADSSERESGGEQVAEMGEVFPDLGAAVAASQPHDGRRTQRRHEAELLALA